MVLTKRAKQNTNEKRQVSSINILAPKITENYLNEANADVEMAYNAFINAGNELSEAVKEQEYQGKHASINAAQRYLVYRSIMEQAFNEREETERRALEAYRKSIIKSGNICRDTLEAAMEKCKSITDNAWEASLDALKANSDGKIIPASGICPNTKESLHNFVTQTCNFFNKAFRNTKKFIKTKLNLLKTTNAQSIRIKLK